MIVPNAEGILLAALKSDERVKSLAGSRVYTDLPNTRAFPLVRVVRFGGAPPFSGPLVLDVADIQVDVWADAKQTAFDLATAIRHAVSILPGDHRLGTVTGTDVLAMRYQPDDTFDPAKPRYICDVRLFVKPTPAL